MNKEHRFLGLARPSRTGVGQLGALATFLAAGLSACGSSGGTPSQPEASGGGPGTGGRLGDHSGGASAPGTGGSSSGGSTLPLASGGSSGAPISATTGGQSSSGGAVSTGGAPLAGTGGTSGGRSGGGGAPGAPAQTGGTTGNGGTPGRGGMPGAGGTPAPGGGPSYPYIFSVFNDSAAKSDLIIYVSNDALNFTLLYDTGFSGPTGFLRDPSIMKHTDGKFYVAFTTPPGMGCCGDESSFSIASSSNLKDWTNVVTVPSGVPGVKNTWAPEWFKDRDGSVYAIVNVDGKSYRYKAMNDSLTMFSGPTWIGIGPGYIDTFIVTVGDTYHAFTKNNATYIEHATSASLDGPWDFVGKNDWAGWGTHKEAGAMLDLGNGTWRFFCDAGSAGHEMYSDSKDMFMTWTAPKTLPAVGNNISHGTVIKGN